MHQAVQVAPLHCAKKLHEDLAMRFRRGVEARATGSDMSLGAAEELAAGRFGFADDRGDLGVFVAEDLSQQEHRALYGGQLLQRHQERQCERLVQFGLRRASLL